MVWIICIWTEIQFRLIISVALHVLCKNIRYKKFRIHVASNASHLFLPFIDVHRNIIELQTKDFHICWQKINNCIWSLWQSEIIFCRCFLQSLIISWCFKGSSAWIRDIQAKSLANNVKCFNYMGLSAVKVSHLSKYSRDSSLWGPVTWHGIPVCTSPAAKGLTAKPAVLRHNEMQDFHILNPKIKSCVLKGGQLGSKDFYLYQLITQWLSLAICPKTSAVAIAFGDNLVTFLMQQVIYLYLPAFQSLQMPSPNF